MVIYHTRLRQVVKELMRHQHWYFHLRCFMLWIRHVFHVDLNKVDVLILQVGEKVPPSFVLKQSRKIFKRYCHVQQESKGNSRTLNKSLSQFCGCFPAHPIPASRFVRALTCPLDSLADW